MNHSPFAALGVLYEAPREQSFEDWKRLTRRIGSNPSAKRKVAAGRRRRPLRQTIPTPAQAAASATTKPIVLRDQKLGLGVNVTRALPNGVG